MPGTVVIIPWTVTGVLNEIDHWFYEQGGRRGWDWDYRIHIDDDNYKLSIHVKFRKGKESMAVLAKLQWL